MRRRLAGAAVRSPIAETVVGLWLLTAKSGTRSSEIPRNKAAIQGESALPESRLGYSGAVNTDGRPALYLKTQGLRLLSPQLRPLRTE